MSHEVETMAYVNQVPWHGLGVDLTEMPNLDAETFLRYAGLNWTVYLESMQAECGLVVPEHFAVVRDGADVHGILGVVGKDYYPLQNSDLFGLPNDLLEAGLVSYECAGSLFNGKQVWALARMADVNVVRKYTGRLDTVQQFLLWTARHDGQASTVGGTTRVRVVCANTMDAAMSAGLGDRVAIQHRSQGAKRLQEAHKFFAERIKAAAKFEDEAQALADKPMSVETFRGVASEWVDEIRKNRKVKTKSGIAKREQVVEDLVRYFGEGTGNTGETAWDGYNGGTEWLDHQRARYEAAAEDNRQKADAFMQSTLHGENFRKKGKLLALLKKA